MSVISLTIIIDGTIDLISRLYVGFSYSKNYEFHITLAYRILPINESNARALLAVTKEKIHNMLAESRQFSLLPVGTPELCTFADMSAFHKM